MRDEISLGSPDKYFDSGSFMPRVRLLQHGLSDHDVPKHRWRYFPKMQMDDVLCFEQFDLDAALHGHVSFHVASADPTAMPDAPVGQSMECHVLPFVPCSEPNSSPVLPSDAVAKEVAFSFRAWRLGFIVGPRVV